MRSTTIYAAIALLLGAPPILAQSGSSSDEAQIRALANENGADGDFAQRVFEMSGGNPLFTEEIVRDAIERGDPSGSVTIPESLSDVVHERVARLGDEAQRLLRVASVAGDRRPFRSAQTRRVRVAIASAGT